MKDSDFLLVGKVVGVHGVKGSVRIYSYGRSCSAFQNKSTFYIKNKSAENFKKYTISDFNFYKQVIRIKFKEIESRSEAENLVGSDIFIEKNKLPKLEKGLYYWFQLIGLSVFTIDEELLGVVEEIFATGANDVLVVKNEKNSEVLLPFIESLIDEVNLDEKFLRIDLPDGLR